MITTDAWVLHVGPKDMDPRDPIPGELCYERFSFPEPADDEVLVEPLYGSWEANMSHALDRSPVDVARQRGEDSIVIGNFGLVRAVRAGRDVTTVKEGDLCLQLAFARTDNAGYVRLVHAYDAPNTIGVLARQTKTRAQLLLPLPPESTGSPLQWAASYGRYWTAWDNWKVAHACWKAQRQAADGRAPLVFGWGGGVVLAELELAKRDGFRAAMASGNPKRLDEIEARGIIPVDRRLFPDLSFDQRRMDDPGFRRRYRESERAFLKTISELSGGSGAAIIIDNIGKPVYRATLRALGRQGVLSTVGWKHGMELETVRANECIKRHIHVHTHACCFLEVAEMADYQERTAWFPPIDAASVYGFDEIPQLAADYAAGLLDTYFPVFRINEH
jgi:NADPH:quinone reductase-like Zn-dependent oxidoreductase